LERQPRASLRVTPQGMVKSAEARKAARPGMGRAQGRRELPIDVHGRPETRLESLCLVTNRRPSPFRSRCGGHFVLWHFGEF
jgi:hypothetical protein